MTEDPRGTIAEPSRPPKPLRSNRPRPARGELDSGAGSAPARQRFPRGLGRGHQLGMLIVLLSLIFFALHGARHALAPAASDFRIYYDAAGRALHGGAPFEVYGYLYLPFFAVFGAPLAWLPYRAAACLFVAASLATLLFSAGRATRAAGADEGGVHPALWWLPLALVTRLSDSNLSNSQVNAFTLAMLLMAFGHLRARRDALAGAWIGLATAFKVVPAFLIGYLLLRRRPRAAGAALVTLLVLTVLVPLPLLGWQHNLDQLAHWWTSVASPGLAGGNEFFLTGQGLATSVYRSLRDPLALPGEGLHWLVAALAGAHLLVFAWIVEVRRRRGWRIDTLEFGLALCSALLLAPLVHKAHLLWGLVGVTALCARFAERSRRRSAACVCFCLGLAMIGLSTPAAVGRVLATELLESNIICLGFELIWVALVLEALRPGGRRAAPDGGPDAAPDDGQPAAG